MAHEVESRGPDLKVDARGADASQTRGSSAKKPKMFLPEPVRFVWCPVRCEADVDRKQ